MTVERNSAHVPEQRGCGNRITGEQRARFDVEDSDPWQSLSCKLTVSAHEWGEDGPHLPAGTSSGNGNGLTRLLHTTSWDHEII